MKINSGSKQQKRLKKKGTAQGCNENEGKRKTYTNWRDKSGTKSHTRIHFASFSSNDIRRQLLTTLTFCMPIQRAVQQAAQLPAQLGDRMYADRSCRAGRYMAKLPNFFGTADEVKWLRHRDSANART